MLLCAARGGASENFGFGTRLGEIWPLNNVNNVNNNKGLPTLNNVKDFWEHYANVGSQS